jgi:hypothetical protein
MSEFSYSTIMVLLGVIAGGFLELVIVRIIYQRSNHQSPTIWRMRNSKVFKKLKEVYFQEE